VSGFRVVDIARESETGMAEVTLARERGLSASKRPSLMVTLRFEDRSEADLFQLGDTFNLRWTKP
jgi:hypothetical protein